jgi:hypothetical protein
MCGEVIAFTVPADGDRMLGLEYCLVPKFVLIITSYTAVVLSHAEPYTMARIPRHSTMMGGLVVVWQDYNFI